MIERELKFELDLDRPVPRLDGVGPVARQDGPVKSTLEATYFDTAGLHLLREWITLRRRTGGHDTGWHLKLPRADGHREEVTEPLGQGQAIPRTLRDRLGDVLGDREPGPVARIRTTRFSYPLLAADGRPLATLTDDHVTAEVSSEAHGLDSWREIELELAEDTDDELRETLGEALRHAGLRPSEWPSKLRRALRHHHLA